MELIYLEIKKKKFNKLETLNKFIRTKVYTVVSVRKKVKGVYYELKYKMEGEQWN
jgi:hypothetical protein